MTGIEPYGESPVPSETLKKAEEVTPLAERLRLALLPTDLKLSDVNYKRAHTQTMVRPWISHESRGCNKEMAHIHMRSNTSNVDSHVP